MIIPGKLTTKGGRMGVSTPILAGRTARRRAVGQNRQRRAVGKMRLPLVSGYSRQLFRTKTACLDL